MRLTPKRGGRNFADPQDGRFAMPQKSLLLSAALIFAAPAFAQRMLPEGAGKDTVAAACASCHALTNITNAGHSRADWETVVHMMVNVGAKVPPGQLPVVVDYL